MDQHHRTHRDVGLVPMPLDHIATGCRWVLVRCKTKPDGGFDIPKARVVAQLLNCLWLGNGERCIPQLESWRGNLNATARWIRWRLRTCAEATSRTLWSEVSWASVTPTPTTRRNTCWVSIIFKALSLRLTTRECIYIRISDSTIEITSRSICKPEKRDGADLGELNRKFITVRETKKLLILGLRASWEELWGRDTEDLPGTIHRHDFGSLSHAERKPGFNLAQQDNQAHGAQQNNT